MRYCDECLRPTDRVLCPECRAVVEQRVRLMGEALRGGVFVGPGDLGNYRRDTATLREDDDRAPC